MLPAEETSKAIQAIELGRERDHPEEVIRSVKLAFFHCISCDEKLTSISWGLAKYAWVRTA
jgi:hypothetical protein